ncbi:MAG TPA: Gldg family protein [Xanthomonadaceae bacterium]|nr:Gldg family protein [Xanthomonadaceae bacterium]
MDLQLNRRLYTAGTLIALLAIFVGLVVLSGMLLRGARLDLTQDRLYTLSDGTVDIVRGIQEPINLYFFFSEDAARGLPGLASYATRVRELVEEIAARGGERIRLEIVDPLPFSEAEDRAAEFGLTAAPVGAGGDAVYLGLAGTNSTDGQAAIPFFHPEKEAFLEYDIAKLIHSLVTAERTVVGLMSWLDIGPGFDPAAGGPREGWVIDNELRQLFALRRVETTATQIPAEIDVLVVVHPRSPSEDTVYAIDQFVLGGGRMVVFVDPHAESEGAPAGMDPQMAMLQPRASDLPKLFQAWGVRYAADRVVLDAINALQIRGGVDGRPQRHLAILGLGEEDLDQDDVVSASLAPVNLSTAGHFELAEGASAILQPLAQSSEQSATVGAERVRFLPDPESLFADFQPNARNLALAARLTGTLKSAFPERAGEGHLQEGSGPANVILFADTDLLSDRLWVEATPFFGQRLLNAFAKNGDLVVNAIDNLAGSSALISVRARKSSMRPFLAVEALQRQADDRLRSKEQELQRQLTELERKLAELQRGEGAEGAIVLGAEQQAGLQRFIEDRARIRKELRQVRRQLDADIAALGAWLKFWNMAAVPLLLTVLGLVAWGWRNRRRRQLRLEART